MSDLKRYLELKAKVDAINKKVERARGALENELSRLKKKFGCESFEDGKRILKKFKIKRDEAKKKFNCEYEQFKNKWGEKL